MPSDRFCFFSFTRAYRYTTVTSAVLLAAFTDPAVMLFSILILRTRYTYRHVIGVALCLAGLAASIANDLASVV